jgi:hypothetical protein
MINKAAQNGEQLYGQRYETLESTTKLFFITKDTII